VIVIVLLSTLKKLFLKKIKETKQKHVPKNKRTSGRKYDILLKKNIKEGDDIKN
jgi:hypothetical protein